MKATEVTAGLAESNGSLLPGLWRDSLHVTCGLTACTPGPVLRAQRSVTSMGKLYLYSVRPRPVDCCSSVRRFAAVPGAGGELKISIDRGGIAQLAAPVQSRTEREHHCSKALPPIGRKRFRTFCSWKMTFSASIQLIYREVESLVVELFRFSKNQLNADTKGHLSRSECPKSFSADEGAFGQ